MKQNNLPDLPKRLGAPGAGAQVVGIAQICSACRFTTDMGEGVLDAKVTVCSIKFLP